MMDNEWKIDEHGQRYRMVGNVQEFETMIRINGIEVPQSELSAFHERQKAAEEEWRKKEMEAFKNKPPVRCCPFDTGMSNQCKREKCSLFLDGKFSISIIADSYGVEIDDKPKGKCPFSVYGRCESCAMFNHGCAVVRLAVATNKD